MIIETLKNIQKKCPNLFIGGSVSLILQEAIPYRKIKDIDLISTYCIIENRYRNNTSFRHDNILFEVFYNPKARYVVHSSGLLLSPVDEIMEWKLKFQRRARNNNKNNNDIKFYNIYKQKHQ